MFRRYLRYPRFLLACVLCISSMLNPSMAANPVVKETTLPTFDTQQATITFEKLNLSLSVQQLSIDKLNEAIKQLTPLTESADRCVSDAQKHINELDLQIEQAGGKQPSTDTKAEKPTADLEYLNSERKKFADKQAACRLFSIKAKEAIQAYKTAATQLKQARAYSRGEPIWTLMKGLKQSDLTVYFPESTPTLPPFFLSALVWGIGLLLALGLSGLLLFKITHNAVMSRYLHLKKISPHYLILLTATLLTGFAFVYLAIFETNATELLYNLLELTFIYLLGLCFILVLFKVRFIEAFFLWYGLDRQFFKGFILTALSVYALIGYALLLLKPLEGSYLTWEITRTGLLWFVTGITVSFIYRFCQKHQRLAIIKRYGTIIKHLSLVLGLGVIVTDAVGYHTLALHVAMSSIRSIGILFLGALTFHGTQKLYTLISEQPTIRQRMIAYFGYKKDSIFTEILILRITLQTFIVVTTVLLIGLCWGFYTQGLKTTLDILSEGIHISNVTIYPLRIIMGVIIYSLLFLGFRALSTRVSRRERFEAEEDTQVAIASLLTYIGFCVAAIISLLIAGFDFTGLAIIAGALSVGIGLGLQSIVNNFVSGLILLLEKPIKPGDRITIDGLEGYVKKIQVRSTHVLTLSREDIIIPNSDLITHRVTNYMYSDKIYRISCNVGVSYDSDIHLVRDTLLAVANSHEKVIHNGTYKPFVLFKSFGDSALDFCLRCVITDVNNKAYIKSDILFKIAEVFKEKNITIAYPQRDVHLKLDEVKALAQSLPKDKKPE